MKQITIERDYLIKLFITLLTFTFQNLFSQDSLSRASKLLIQKGIQFTCWIGTGPGDDTFPVDSLWSDLNFTGPTFFSGPLYNKEFIKKHPMTQWSLAKGPFGDTISESPKNSDHFLTTDQQSNLKNLSYISFGDEERYSEKIVFNLENWFTLSKKLYPNVLVLNSRCHDPGGLEFCEWNLDQSKHYLSKAKPDILTFDWYYFSEINPMQNGGSLTDVYNNLTFYRNLALGGYDGTGKSPIAFGQYLLGYKTGTHPQGVGSYIISESQIHGVANATLLMGGKFLSLFRYRIDHKYFIFHNENNSRTNQYWQYSDLAAGIKKFSPYLVKLNSENLYFLPGKYKLNNSVLSNPTPNGFNGINKPIKIGNQTINAISASNLGKLNNSLEGDVVIGTFNLLPGLKDTSISNKGKYFMIMNGLTNSYSHIGTGDATLQRISINFTTDNYTKFPFKRINKKSGLIENIPIINLGCGEYLLELYIKGGDAELIISEDKPMTNIALLKPTSQSSIHGWGASSLAVDGNTNGDFFKKSVTHTSDTNSMNPYWEVDLIKNYKINEIQLYNRTDCCADRLKNFYIFLSNKKFESDNIQLSIGNNNIHSVYIADKIECPTSIQLNYITAKYIRIQKLNSDPLSISEVKVFGDLIDINTANRQVIVSEFDIKIFPNPLYNDYININCNYNCNVKYSIIDLNGKIIQYGLLNHTENRINLGNINNGVYNITFTNSKGDRKVKRIVKI